jgi:hypothetical protein
MIRTWDFDTCSCGKSHNSEVFSTRKIPQELKCACGKKVGWAKAKQNHIHTTISGQYGKVDPRFGKVVDSYGHKKQLLREYGMEEGDIERHDDIQNDVGDRVQRQERHERDPNTLVADSLEEITERINKETADQGGTPLRDPRMIESATASF